jgi:hypothetical protein
MLDLVLRVNAYLLERVIEVLEEAQLFQYVILNFKILLLDLLD